ncbi:MAG: hypothetical protein KDE55_24810 [Novosphingobium sp.]|nr:hypothetical protein [Sphingobium sp.]MCB2080909.1 hypothetical protein [Novosphingobium sp.]MCP5399449.1 hypothetical protein [Sphingomonas sp.]
MSDVETLKAEVKKASARAMQAKMDLHDLSEELPQGIENVMEVAERTRDAYALLAAKKAELKKMEAMT